MKETSMSSVVANEQDSKPKFEILSVSAGKNCSLMKRFWQVVHGGLSSPLW